MSSQQEVFTGGVLRITMYHMYYPVSEETLQQVFTVYGVVKISMFQRIHHVEVVVQLRSRSGAAQALAMHGRCIYERACLLDIQDVSPAYNLHLCSLLEQKQTATVAKYTAVFWECVQRVLDINPNLSIKSFIHQYIEGLREDIQDVVRSRSPSSITGASSLARIREDEIAEEVAMVAEKLDDDHGVHGLVPMVIVMDVFPELAAPAECGADHGDIAIDSSSLAAVTPITCSMECPSHDATFDIFLKPAVSTVCDEALNIETVHVTAPTPAICSTDDLAHGSDDENLVPFPVMRLFSTPEVGPSTFIAVLVFTNANEVPAHQFIPDVTPGWNPQGKVVRLAPWPSFLDEGTSTDRGEHCHGVNQGSGALCDLARDNDEG